MLNADKLGSETSPGRVLEENKRSGYPETIPWFVPCTSPKMTTRKALNCEYSCQLPFQRCALITRRICKRLTTKTL
ncbi:hypothetical protein MTO96_003485 [Rhipicephalus appendiculatus]